jgi:hypothetical protein
MVRLVYQDEGPIYRRQVKKGTDERDVLLLLRYLSLARNRRYIEAPAQDGGSPTVQTFRETGRRGASVAVEWAELSKADLKLAGCFLRARGVAVRQGWHRMDLETFAVLVEEAVRLKVGGSGLSHVNADERIMLVRSRVEGADESTFLWSPFNFEPPSTIDHLFVVARANLLQCW